MPRHPPTPHCIGRVPGKLNSLPPLMITKDSIETAYSFLHQKRNVYIHSSLDWQQDDIEVAIGSYVDDMNPELYATLSAGRSDFLRDHSRFRQDITEAVEQLEDLLAGG